jgi:hypothetical protein
MSTDKNLSEQFDGEMMDVYVRAKDECQYDAKLFRQMIGPGRGVNAAKTLLKAPRVQSGFERLRQKGRLDISMEARMLKPKYAELFERDELKEARTRLELADYDIRKCYE